ncbi:hypothetical protein G6O67_000640 [Ophiocordyceps sinensis]|uniref:Uncharacterized protein n=2 Tax=Ophiocordyceps sinensis TaxID=72228 RepID=A0A8H4V9V3_9HYPO|nr:hypothetical protein OCS_02696 [Ophiocordyceps sinensis CO18]KAF4513362.1 hypothetical protein G6O67_000640 [Ophiocordyceps sinensis]
MTARRLRLSQRAFIPSSQLLLPTEKPTKVLLFRSLEGVAERDRIFAELSDIFGEATADRLCALTPGVDLWSAISSDDVPESRRVPAVTEEERDALVKLLERRTKVLPLPGGPNGGHVCRERD